MSALPPATDTCRYTPRYAPTGRDRRDAGAFSFRSRHRVLYLTRVCPAQFFVKKWGNWKTKTQTEGPEPCNQPTNHQYLTPAGVKFALRNNGYESCCAEISDVITYAGHTEQGEAIYNFDYTDDEGKTTAAKLYVWLTAAGQLKAEF